MGAAPSHEILRTAPFRTPHGGARQIALIPFVKDFFPSVDCPLFQQLYEARMDPSVRYYMRNENSDMRQDRIPPVTHSCEELYEMYIASPDKAPVFETNEDLRNAVAQGRADQVRPVPCAVVFLYEGATHIPEGSIRLTRDRDVYVKVIGGIGDASNVFQQQRLRQGYYHVQMFITKSAGDHNMGRVALLATYIYRHQCIDIVGLAEPPLTPVLFVNLKTNIPFLCFLRELRDRTTEDLTSPQIPAMWLEDDYIRGGISREFAQNMCTTFANHFLAFAEAKANQRAAKQIRRLGCHNSRILSDLSGTCEGLAAVLSSDTAALSCGSGIGGITVTPDGSGGDGSPPTQGITVTAGGSSGMSTLKPKITYAVRGYITEPEATILAESKEANEVYVCCSDSMVRVVSPVAGVGAEQVTKGVSTSPKVTGRASTATAGASRDEGRLIACDVAPPLTAEQVAAMDAAAKEKGVIAVFYVRRGEILSYANKPTSAVGELNRGASEKGVSEGEKPRPGGCWRVDSQVFIENVLLSLVRDECKNAREADVDDPRWVRDEEKNCPVHDDSFYIWRFRRGVEVFYYGTVPKFANPNRRRSGGGAGLGGSPNKTSPAYTRSGNGGSVTLYPGGSIRNSSTHYHRGAVPGSLGTYSSPNTSSTNPIMILANQSGSTQHLPTMGNSVPSLSYALGSSTAGMNLPPVLSRSGTAALFSPGNDITMGDSSNRNNTQRPQQHPMQQEAMLNSGWPFNPRPQQMVQHQQGSQQAPPPPPPYTGPGGGVHNSFGPGSAPGQSPKPLGSFTEGPLSHGRPPTLDVNYGSPVNSNNTHTLGGKHTTGIDSFDNSHNNNSAPNLLPPQQHQQPHLPQPQRVVVLGPNGQQQVVEVVSSPSPSPTQQPQQQHVDYIFVNGQMIPVPSPNAPIAQQQPSQEQQQQRLLQSLLQSLGGASAIGNTAINNNGSSPGTNNWNSGVNAGGASAPGPNGQTVAFGDRYGTAAASRSAAMGMNANSGNFCDSQVQQPQQQLQQTPQGQLTLQELLLLYQIQQQLQQQLRQQQQQQQQQPQQQPQQQQWHPQQQQQQQPQQPQQPQQQQQHQQQQHQQQNFFPDVTMNDNNMSGADVSDGDVPSSMTPQIANWILQQQQLLSSNRGW